MILYLCLYPLWVIRSVLTLLVMGPCDHADSNLQIFPPAYDTRENMTSLFRPPNDADGMHLHMKNFLTGHVFMLNSFSYINISMGAHDLCYLWILEHEC